MFDVNKIRQDFPMLNNHKDMIYFDNGATTYKPKVVIDKINEVYNDYTSNVHRGDYVTSEIVNKEYDETREVVAKFINAQAKEIVYTTGATYSLNQMAMYGLNNLKKGDRILTLISEHSSSVLPWFRVSEKTLAGIEYIKQNEEGLIDLEAFKKQMDENVKVVVIAHVSNILGYIQPIKEICKIAHSYNAIVMVDGAQSVPHIKIDVKDLDVDFLAFSSHKMCGPSGVGILYGKYELLDQLEPVFLGGGSNINFFPNTKFNLQHAPLKFEAGTPNIEGIIGFKEAVKYLDSIGIDNISKYELELKKYAIEKLKTLGNIELYSPNSDTGIIAFNIKDVFAQDAASYLSYHNICVRSGNHCAKMISSIINRNDTVRASMYFYNTKEEVDKFYEVLKGLNLESALSIYF